MKPKRACRVVQYRPNETKMKYVAQIRAEIWRILWNIFVSTYEEWDNTAYYCHPLSPTLLVFDTRKHTKWECTRSSTQVYAKIHCFINNTVALRGVKNQHRLSPWFLKLNSFGGRRVRTAPFGIFIWNFGALFLDHMQNTNSCHQ